MTKTRWLSRHIDGRHFRTRDKGHMPPMKFVSGVAGVSAGLMALRAARGGKVDSNTYSTYSAPSTKEWPGIKFDYRYIEDVAQKMLLQGYDAKTIEKILSQVSKMKDISFNDIVMKIQLPMAGQVGTDINTLDTFVGRLIKYDVKKGGKFKQLRRYHAYWSDNMHAFGTPHILPKGASIEFPDVFVDASNIEEAKRKIEILNKEAKGKDREDVNLNVLFETRSGGKAIPEKMRKKYIASLEQQKYDLAKEYQRTKDPETLQMWKEVDKKLGKILGVNENKFGGDTGIDADYKRPRKHKRFGGDTGVDADYKGGKVKVRKEYRVYEDNKVLVETDDKAEANRVWRDSHRKTPGKFHELHKWSTKEGHYTGISQFAPGDKVRW